MVRKTPLAWLQLVKQKTRLAVAVAGIAFADILMFTQMGFEASLFESTMRPQRGLKADLVMVNPQFETMFSVRSFSRQRLYQALAYEGVESVSPLYIELGQWRNPETRKSRTILVFGTDPGMIAFNDPEIEKNRVQLQMFNHVLFDQAGRPEYGAVATWLQQQGRVETELNGVGIQVTGLFSMGASFAADGNVIASDSTFLHMFPTRQPKKIEVGLIQLKPGADIQQIVQILNKGLPDGVVVLTRENFAEREKNYWANATPIGFIFVIGVMVSFVVGTVIVYQILYTDVSEHLPEYATLKAMGYSDRYLLVVLAQEAFLLATLGYLPGAIFSVGLYHLAAGATLLPIFMTVERAVTVFGLTLVMCFISGAVAMRKLQSADPADIF